MSAPHDPLSFTSVLSTAFDVDNHRAVLDALPTVVWCTDIFGRCIYVNRTCESFFSQNAAAARDQGWMNMIVADDRPRVAERWIASIVSQVAFNGEYRVQRGDGSIAWVQHIAGPMFSVEGRFCGFLGVINDVTATKVAQLAASAREAQVRESEERLHKFAEATHEGIVFHEHGVVTDCNNAILQLLGRRSEEVVGHALFEFIAPADHERVQDYVRRAREHPYEVTLCSDGRPLPVEAIGKTMPFRGSSHRLVAVRDIRDRKEAEARIQFLARHDALTGLPNRFALAERLDQVLASAKRNARHAAILFIDLDHFKIVNDSLGHHMGDVLLKTVARRILQVLRAADVVARLGGDEFLVVLSDIASENDAVPVAEKLLESIGQPITLEGNAVAVSPSIGISVYPRDGATADALIKNADAAMYLAKERGRANYQFFSPRLSEAAFEALALESNLREAIRRGEFVLHYQPQVDVKTGMLTGAEALLRWNHPEQGLVIPERFITLAEQRGLIVPIGAWVLREACAQAAAWQRQGLMPITVAVNLSALQVKQASLVGQVDQVLRETGLAPQRLEIELTESMLSDDVPQMAATLQALKNLGVQIALDDFGTGYSSLAHLKRFPLDRLKIDRSFVRDIPDDADDVAIAAAIIDMGKNLGMTIIAEGVETEAQRAFLADRGCHAMQGYMVSAALPAEAMGRFIAAAAAQSRLAETL